MASVALRLAGGSYTEIAEALDFATPDDARRAVEATLANEAITAEDRDTLRTQESMRLQRLLRSVWAKATDDNHPEHLTAVRVARELIERNIKLHGLDAPTEITVHTPTQDEIEQWVHTITQQSNAHYLALEARVVEPSES